MNNASEIFVVVVVVVVASLLLNLHFECKINIMHVCIQQEHCVA